MSKYGSIADLLRFFVETERYGIIDRIGNAVSPAAVKQALFEALRIVRSLKGTSKKGKVNDKVYECCEYGDIKEGKHHPGLEAAIDGKRQYCVPCPRIPSEDEVREFLEDVERDIDVAREVAILAQTFRPKKEVSSG